MEREQEEPQPMEEETQPMEEEPQQPQTSPLDNEFRTINTAPPVQEREDEEVLFPDASETRAKKVGYY
jgi:hypothetical protein